MCYVLLLYIHKSSKQASRKFLKTTGSVATFLANITSYANSMAERARTSMVSEDMLKSILPEQWMNIAKDANSLRKMLELYPSGAEKEKWYLIQILHNQHAKRVADGIVSRIDDRHNMVSHIILGNMMGVQHQGGLVHLTRAHQKDESTDDDVSEDSDTDPKETNRTVKKRKLSKRCVC